VAQWRAMTDSILPRIGVIGGSGLYDIEGLEIVEERPIETPFGSPSDPLVIGRLDGVPVAFLTRHGRGHRLLPSEINFRANIWAMKQAGVEMILSASAVGSMKEQYRPTHILFPNQFIDRTKGRHETFFGDGVVVHVSMADPVCHDVATVGTEAARAIGAEVHYGGTYVCIEGPQFSARAESMLYRSWGVDVIGMTNLTEAKLAREAEICYATMALVTDYDCWHDTEEAVNVEQVIAYLHKNAKTACDIVRGSVQRLAERSRSCPCAEALRYAILTPGDQIPPRRREQLAPLLGKYLENS
jgi:5'-methylthioadenosine phosphorylase